MATWSLSNICLFFGSISWMKALFIIITSARLVRLSNSSFGFDY